MKFSVNIDQSFIEQARKRYRNEESIPQNSSPVQITLENKENIPTDSPTFKKNESIETFEELSTDEKPENKFSTANLLLEGIHQSRIKQKHNRVHLKNLQNTVEDALAIHLSEQIDLVNTYAPKFNTPRYNCMEQYKGLQDCYTSFNGGYKCDAVFKDFMRCYRNTRRQYFELREL